MSGFWKVCSFLCTQYLVGPPFAWITAAMRCSMETISPWHCSGVMKHRFLLIATFGSSALLGLVSLIFLLTIPNRLSMKFSSGEFAGQSSTVIPWPWSEAIRSSVTPCNWVTVQCPGSYRGFPRWVSLGTELARVDQRSWVLVLCVRCRSWLQKTDARLLPALL